MNSTLTYSDPDFLRDRRRAKKIRSDENLSTGMTETRFKPVLERALAHALDHLDHLETRPVGATVPLATLRERLAQTLNSDSLAAERVIDDLVTDVAGGVLGSAGGRFFGWVIGGFLPAAPAAGWLASAWGQKSASYPGGPAPPVLRGGFGRGVEEGFGVSGSAPRSLP